MPAVASFASPESFYRNSIATQSTKGTFNSTSLTRTTYPLTRMEFGAGAGIAIIMTIHNLFFAIVFSVATICTIGTNRSLKNRCFKYLAESWVYSRAIPIGLLGMLLPKAINNRIGIPRKMVENV